MSLGYQRCPEDDSKAGVIVLAVDPTTGVALEGDIHCAAAGAALYSAFLTVSAAVKTGSEIDFLEKVALGLAERVSSDIHAVCPVVNILCMTAQLLAKQAVIATDPDGHVLVVPKEDLSDTGRAIPYAEPGCIFASNQDDNEENLDDETDRHS